MKKLLTVLLSLALVACMLPASAFAVTLAEGETITGITVEPISDQPYTGNEIKPQLKVTATVSTTNATRTSILDGSDYTATWSSNTNVGTAKISVKLNSAANINDEKNFGITARDLSDSTSANKVLITVPPQESGTNDQIAIKLKDAIVFRDANNQVLALNKDIKVTVTDVDANNKNVKIEPADGNANVTSSFSVNFSVKQGISNCELTGVIAQNYTGNPVTIPNMALKTAAGASISNSYYDLIYSNNTHAGTATVKAVGKNGYMGETISYNFAINAVDASTAYSRGVIRVADIPNQIVNASEVKPTVTVTEVIGNKTNTLQQGTDYTVAYEGNTVAGTGTAKITFNRDYTGTINKTFTILSANNDIANSNIDIAVTNYTKTFNGYTQTPTIVVKNKTSNVTLTSRDYTVTYTLNGKTVKDPKDVGPYGIEISGIGSYGGTKYVGYLKIDKREINTTAISGLSSSYVYSGVPLEPAFTLKYGNYTLVKGTDYTVKYYENSSSGAYARGRIVATGIGNFTGEVTNYFYITGKSITNCTAYFTNGRSSSAYTNSAITPAVTVRDGYNYLTNGTDYTISYTDANGKYVSSLKDSGTYNVNINGKGNYSGTLTLKYTITGIDISYYTVTLSSSQVAADGYYKTPVITSVAYGASSRLLSSDYTVSYQDSTGKTVTYMSAAGVYKVVVTGKNGYSGSTYATFTIKGLPQTVTATEDSYKVYADSDTFRLGASATGDGTGFTYTSSNPAVASVSALGYVTMHKMGRAVITISTTGTKKYDPASDTVVIKVYPKKAVVTKKPWTDGKKSQFKVRWTKQQDATRYEVRYSRNKSFTSGTYITKKVTPSTLAYTTQSTTVKGLKSGYTYYVKVRAVKEVYNDYGQKLTYYGAWSGWRSIRTK